MGIITKTIGTSSRDYSTISSWEADLDNGAVYSSADDAVGECYNDSTFDETVTINGGGTVGLATTTLTVASGERHDGTAGSGARIVASTTREVVLSPSATIERHVTWLEIDLNGNSMGFTYEAAVAMGAGFSQEHQSVRNCIVHDLSTTGGSAAIGIFSSGYAWVTDYNYASNNIVYDISRNIAFGAATGIQLSSSSRAYNNTVHNVQGSGGSSGYGVDNGTCQNNIATNSSTSDFNNTTNHSYHVSSDTSAAGTGSITSVTTADQFVSITGGSEDLHIKAGSDCIDAGTDLTTSPVDVAIDINGRDRDSSGDTWDIGAHELVAAGGPKGVFGMALDGPFGGVVE